MLVNAKRVLKRAKNNRYAIPQFNINNLEWTKYILEACQEVQFPVILGVSEGACNYMGGYNTVANMVKGLLKDLKINIPVVLHLDHGSSVKSCKKAIKSGFTSVMLDFSKETLEQNILNTKKVVNYAKLYNASVEAEIGCIGGIEDDKSKLTRYASLAESIEMVKRTKINMLAAAVGTIHGLSKGTEKIDFELIKEISKNTRVPLVLHGGTGVSKTKIIKAINCGIHKININTGLQISWNKAIRKYIINNKDVYDPRKIIGSGEQAIKATVKEIINVFRNEKEV